MQTRATDTSIQTWSQAAFRARIHQAWQCTDQGVHVDFGGSSRPGDPSAQGISYAAGSSAQSRMVVGGPSADRQGKTCAEHYRDALCAEIARGADATEGEERLCNRR